MKIYVEVIPIKHCFKIKLLIQFAKKKNNQFEMHDLRNQQSFLFTYLNARWKLEKCAYTFFVMYKRMLAGPTYNSLFINLYILEFSIYKFIVITRSRNITRSKKKIQKEIKTDEKFEYDACMLSDYNLFFLIVINC